MAKSFTFVIFVIGFFTTQVLCRTFVETVEEGNNFEKDKEFAKPITQQDASPPENTPAENSEGEDDSDDEGQKDENLSPFLTCLLFETGFACNRTCSLAGLIYGQPITSGTCGDNNDCKCNVSETESLENFWRKKFDSENVLREIRKNKTLSKKILDVLKTPFRTPQETVSDLKPLLSAKLFKSLRIKDKEAQKLFTADGKFDHGAVEKYITKKMKPVKSTRGPDFKKTLEHVLRYSEGSVFDSIHDEIRLSKNELLNETLDEYMKKNNIHRSPLDSAEHKENLISLLDSIVVDKLIKSSPKNPTTQRDPTLNQKSPRVGPNKPDVLAQSLGLSDDWWKLHGFNKIAAGALEIGKKCWDAEGYYSVCLNKDGFKHLLSWRNEKDGVAIEMKILNKKEIKQEWSFPNVVVELNRNLDGTVDEEWKLENSTCQVAKDSKGKIYRMNWSGPKNQEEVQKYKQLINTWCAENSYLSGKTNCIIY